MYPATWSISGTFCDMPSSGEGPAVERRYRHLKTREWRTFYVGCRFYKTAGTRLHADSQHPYPSVSSGDD